MKLKQAKHLGFCFGVQRAVDLAEASASRYKNIYIIGDIVHNEIVSRKIQKLGITKVSSLDEVPVNCCLIIKAHGVPKSVYSGAEKKNLKIIDTTCPMVKDIQKKAEKLEKQGYQVIVIGEKKHEEVRGIIGHSQNSLVIENPGQVKKNKNRLGKKTAVVCQSTQNMENVSAVLARLAPLCKELRFFNTICAATHQRQDEVRRLAGKYASVLVIGSRKSANTTRLYNIAKNINNKTFFVHNEKNLDPAWKRFASIALIGGASTPSALIEKITEKLYDL